MAPKWFPWGAIYVVGKTMPFCTILLPLGQKGTDFPKTHTPCPKRGNVFQNSFHKAALNKLYVFCQEKIQKVRGSEEKKHKTGKNTNLCYFSVQMPKRYERRNRKHIILNLMRSNAKFGSPLSSVYCYRMCSIQMLHLVEYVCLFVCC